MSDRTSLQQKRWPWVALFCVLTASFLAAGYLYYRGEMHSAKERQYKEVHAIAELKIRQIQEWRRDRLADVRVLAHSPYFAEALEKFVRDPKDKVAATRLHRRLMAVSVDYRCHDALLVGLGGEVLESAKEESLILDPTTRRTVEDALSSRRAVFGDFYRCLNCGWIHIDAAAPIIGEGDRPLAVLVLQHDPEADLYPLIQSWPTPSKTAETLLVRKEGEDVLFLNDLRHRPKSALRLREPLSRADMPAVRAVLGRKGYFDGKDYRGVEVLADINPIPDTPWFMIAKVDADEMLAEVRQAAWFVSLLVLMLIALAGVGTGLVFVSRQKGLYAGLYLAEKERSEVREELRATLYSIGDAVITTDTDGFVRHVNRVAEELTGWSEAEALGRPLGEIFHIVNEETREEVEDPVQQVLRDGLVVGLANHTLLIAKDGSQHPIADSGAPIRDEKEQIIGVVLVFRDQTEERAAAKALRDSEERYRQLVEVSPDGVVVHQDGIIVFVNPAGARMLGAESPGNLIGKTMQQVVHPDYWEEARTRIERRLKEGTGLPLVDVYWAKLDGTAFPVEVMASVVMYGGKPAVQVVARDVTDRKHAEQEMQLNQRRLQSLLRISQYESKDVKELLDYALDEALALTRSTIGWFGSYDEKTETMTIQAWSKSVIESCGLRAKPTVFPLENAGIWAEGIRGRQPFILNDYQRPNPNKKGYPEGHAELTRFLIVPFLSGGRIVAVAAVANKDSDYDESDARQLALLTDSLWRIARARRLEEVQRRLSTAIEQAAEGVIITDVEGTIQYVNPALERMTGYTREELLGNTPRIMKSGEHDTLFYRQLWDTINTGKIWAGRFINRMKDGQLYHQDVTISPVKDASGTTINFVAVKRDITEQLELSKQLLRAQKLEAVGTLAGGVAHDFNNILQVTLGYSELMLEDEVLPERYRADLRKIHESASRGADLVQRLLVFSRRRETKAELLDLNSRISEMRKMLERTLPKMIEIQLVLAEGLARINADPTQVDQVLMNLAVNARDAMPDGGKLIIETANITLDEEYSRTHLEVKLGPYVVLIITDTGAGMDEATLEHIFEPFYTTKETGKGTGLGLAMVHGIVQQHGGHIECYSEPGAGTTFKIYFPALVSDEEPEEKVAGPLPHGGSETILLVDDEEMILDLCSRILSKAGYRVITASNGKEALELYQARSDEIALVILDLIMPEMGGKRCLAELLSLDPSAKVVIATGFSAEGPTKDALAAGAKGFVNKPYIIRQLLEMVREVLDRG